MHHILLRTYAAGHHLQAMLRPDIEMNVVLSTITFRARSTTATIVVAERAHDCLTRRCTQSHTLCPPTNNSQAHANFWVK
jgi:hypothetical protein